jgi:integrase
VDQILRPNWKTAPRSSHSSDRAIAENLLKNRLGEVARGLRVIGTDAERLSFEDLARLITNDYELNGRKSIAELQSSLRALGRYFGGYKARDINFDTLTAYAAERRRSAAAATVARELAQLHHAFVLAERSGRAECPRFPTLKVNNARRGFFEEREWEALRKHLPQQYQHLGDFAFLTGWRLMEMLRLEWRQIDPEHGIIRLDPGTTKSGRGRVFPYRKLPELTALLDDRATVRDRHRSNGRIVPWVFCDESGAPLFIGRRPKQNFRVAWQRGRDASGLPGRYFHDFRRTAVRNLDRAGVSRAVAMELVGLKTDEIYRRYDIVDERDLERGVETLAAAKQIRLVRKHV